MSNEPPTTDIPPMEDEKAHTPRIVAVDAHSLLKMELKPREMLLSPWLPEQGVAMLYAMRGIGKTWVSLTVACTVAAGGEALGWKAPRPRGAMFIDGEMPAPVLQERAASIIASEGFSPQAPLIFITPDLQPQGTLDLGCREDQDALTPHLRGIDLVIVDNISTLCRTGKENEGESWTPVQEWALRLRAEGKSVLFVHHAGKGGNQRGTSKREDILDTVIALKRPARYEFDQGAVFEVHFEKARGFYGKDAAPFEARLSVDDQGKAEWITRSLDDSTFDKVVRLVREEGLSAMEIAKELDVHKSTISRHLKKARGLGLLSTNEGSGA